MAKKNQRTREHNGKTYTISAAHPVADVFPWMSDEDITALASDIKANGQKYKIKRTPDKLIVDGRNRELACFVAKVEPQYIEEELSEDEIYNFAKSANFARRSASKSQLAITAAYLLKLKPGRAPAADADKITREEAAQFLGVSTEYIRMAKIIIASTSSQVVDCIREEKLTINEAYQLVGTDLSIQRAVTSAKKPSAQLKKVLEEAKNTQPEDTIPTTGEPTKSQAAPTTPPQPKPAKDQPSPSPTFDTPPRPQPKSKPPEQPVTPTEEPKVQPAPTPLNTPLETTRESEESIDPFADNVAAPEPDDADKPPAFHWHTMPFADEAEKLASDFVNWISQAQSLKEKIQRTFPVGTPKPMGKRINASQCVAVLGQIIDTLKANMPTHVCPACCGTGELEAKNGQQPEKCRYCDGYGIVDKETYSRLKAMWKQTRARLLIIRGAN